MFKLSQILRFSFPLISICWIFVLSFTLCHGASRISNNYGYNYQRKPSSSAVLKEELPTQRCSKGSHKRIPDQYNSNKFYMCTYNNAHHIWMVYSFNCPTDTVFDKQSQKCITLEKQQANLLKQNSYVVPPVNKIKLIPNSHTIISDDNSNQGTKSKPNRKTNPNANSQSNSKVTVQKNHGQNQSQKQTQVNLNYPIRIITPTTNSFSNNNKNYIQRLASTTFKPYVRFTNRPTIPSRTATKNRYPQNQPTTIRIPSRFPGQTQAQAQGPVPYTRRPAAAPTTTTIMTTELPSTIITTTATETVTTLPVKSSSESSTESQNQNSNGSEHLGVIKMITGKITYLAQAIDALLNAVESTMKSNTEICNDEKDGVQIRPNADNQNQNQKQDKNENSQLVPPAQSNFNIFDFFKYTPLNLSYNTLNETINRISNSSTTEATTIFSTSEKIQIVHPTSSIVDFMDSKEENVSEDQDQEQEEEEASDEEENVEVELAANNNNNNKNNDITQATSATVGVGSSTATTGSSVEWNVFLNENHKKQGEQQQSQTEKASVVFPSTTSTHDNDNANDSGVLESSTRVNVRVPEEKRVEGSVPAPVAAPLSFPQNLMFPSSSAASSSSSPNKSSQDIINSLESISKVKVGHRRPRRQVSNLF